MNTRAAFFLSVATAAAGFVAAWLIFRSDGTCKIDDASSPVEARGLQRSAPQVRAQQAPPDLERPDSRVPAFTERPSEPTTPAAAPPKIVAAPATSDPSDPRTYPERTLAEIGFKRDEITKLLIQKKRPIVDQRFDSGQFEHVQDDDSWRGGDSEWERHTIYSLRMGKGRGVDRVALSREEFPELYVYKDEEVRLDDLWQTKRRAESEQAAPK
jgi:hypothetical protein